MEISLPYGRGTITVHLPDSRRVMIIESPDVLSVIEPQQAIHEALEKLLGNLSWDMFRSARSVAIAINDKTRPVPHAELLPPLLKRLAEIGIPDTSITFYIAVGTHSPMLPDEFSIVLPPDILRNYRVVSHDCEDVENLIFLGTTSRGTPVLVNRDYFNADLKIVVGNIEPHQLAGFSGGVKTAAIGLSAMKTINTNHSLFTHPNSCLGEYKTNPLRQDIEEIGSMIGVHLALNAVLDLNHRIVKVLAGNPLNVMNQGYVVSRQVCQVGVPEVCGLVIASPGGHPKDINVYQAQKSLAHAAMIVRDQGTIIIIAACPEGSGSNHYEEWAVGKNSYEEIMGDFAKEGFKIGRHKAFLIARDASRVKLHFYSGLDQELAKSLLLNPVKDLQMTIDQALAELRSGELIGILPHASSTIPYINKGGI